MFRPRPKLQRLLAPVVSSLDALWQRAGSLTGVHVRTGYPDWVALSAHANGTARAAWALAASAAGSPLTHRLSYSEHWRLLESFLEECPRRSSPIARGDRPCFSWHYPHMGEAPNVHDAARLCGMNGAGSSGGPQALGLSACLRSQGCRAPLESSKPLRGSGGGSSQVAGSGESAASGQSEWRLRMPGNRTLAATVLCAARLRAGQREAPQASAAAQAGLPTQAGSRTGPSGLLVLGDAPGVASLLMQHPDLRVVDTASSGSLAHTQFDLACSDDAAAQCTRGVADPRGGWSRTMVDFYVGGLTDAFVSALDTTFVDGAVLLRSMSCCSLRAGSRMHFSAASNAATNRDRPMEHTAFLSALMHTATPPQPGELSRSMT